MSHSYTVSDCDRQLERADSRDSRCNILHHAATRRCSLQHTATPYVRHDSLICSIRLWPPSRKCSVSLCPVQHTATHCHTMQHTTIYCNILHHTAVHCCTVQHHMCDMTHSYAVLDCDHQLQSACSRYARCNTLLNTATHCNTLQHIATHCNTLQHTAAHCSTLQHTATHCSIICATWLTHMRYWIVTTNSKVFVLVMSGATHC